MALSLYFSLIDMRGFPDDFLIVMMTRVEVVGGLMQ